MFEVNRFRKGDQIFLTVQIDTRKFLDKLFEGIDKSEIEKIKEVRMVEFFGEDEFGGEISDLLNSRFNYCTFNSVNYNGLKNCKDSKDYKHVELPYCTIAHKICISTLKTKENGKSIMDDVFNHWNAGKNNHSDAGKNNHLDDEFVMSEKVEKTITSMKRKNKKQEDIKQWTSNQWLEYISNKFNDVYGQQSLEFGASMANKKNGKGIIWLKIKNKLIKTFIGMGKDNVALREYVDWCFDIKSVELNFPITLNFLCSPSLIQEWTMKDNKKSTKNIGNKGKLTGKIIKV